MTALKMSEADLEDTIIQAAQLLGYLVHAERPARTNDGWRTPIKGDKGWPDLVICGHGQLFLFELKSAKGRTSPEQDAWIEQLELATRSTGDVRQVAVIRPDHLDDVLDLLQKAAKR